MPFSQTEGEGVRNLQLLGSNSTGRLSEIQTKGVEGVHKHTNFENIIAVLRLSMNCNTEIIDLAPHTGEGIGTYMILLSPALEKTGLKP